MTGELWIGLLESGEQSAIRIAVTTAIVGASAWAVCASLRSAVARRTVAQAAVGVLLIAYALELTGAANAIGAVGQALFATTLDPADEPANDRADHDAKSRESAAMAGSLGDWNADHHSATQRSDDGPATTSQDFALDSTEYDSEPALVHDATSFDAGSLPVAQSIPPPNRITLGVTIGLGVAWCVVSLALILRAVRSQVLLARIARRPRCAVSSTLREEVGRLARTLGVRRPVRLVELPAGTTPVAFGVFRPTIGLPGDFAETFEPTERQAILAHEMGHLAAGDPRWRFYSEFLFALLWWHPAVWIVRRELHLASEEAADDVSRALPDGAEHLAAALVTLGRRIARRRPSAVLAAAGEFPWWRSRSSACRQFRSNLAFRVERLLSQSGGVWRPTSFARLSMLRAAICGFVVICVLFGSVWGRPQRSLPEPLTPGDPVMRQSISSWRNSLAGMALALLAGGPAAADSNLPTAPATASPSASAAATSDVALREDDEDDDDDKDADDDDDDDLEEGKGAKSADKKGHADRDRKKVREDGDDDDDNAKEGKREEGKKRDKDKPKKEGDRKDERKDGEREKAKREKGDHERDGDVRKDRPKGEDDARLAKRRAIAKELDARIGELKRHAAELRERAGEEGAAELKKVQAELERTVAQARELAAEGRERGENARAVAKQKAAELEAEMHRIAERLRAAGDRENEDTKRMRNQLGELKARMAKLMAGDQPREKEGRKEGDRDGGERLRHLKQAIEHLRAAGMPDQAERLAHQFEEMQAKQRELEKAQNMLREKKKRDGDSERDADRERWSADLAEKAKNAFDERAKSLMESAALRLELRQLRDELEKTKAELAKMRQGAESKGGLQRQ